jgi:hypothetical protein
MFTGRYGDWNVKMFSRLQFSCYLEFLVEQKTAKKFVFEELLKEYNKDKNFRVFLQLAENPETWKFVKARKLLELEFGSSLDRLLAKCAVFGKFSVFTRSRSSSRVLIARRIWFAANFLAAGRKHRRPKFINFTFTTFSNFFRIDNRQKLQNGDAATRKYKLKLVNESFLNFAKNCNQGRNFQFFSKIELIRKALA